MVRLLDDKVVVVDIVAFGNMTNTPLPWNLMAVLRNHGTFIDWSANVEAEVDRYEVHYKASAGEPWAQLAEVGRPGYEDTTHRLYASKLEGTPP